MCLSLAFGFLGFKLLGFAASGQGIMGTSQERVSGFWGCGLDFWDFTPNPKP